jgi:hypothetical protein
MSASLDHIVVVADSLDAGAAALERKLGVSLAPGGQHARMGTHNRLLRLGGDAYLEVIAIDPGAPAPAHRRWFELDDAQSRARLRSGPRLTHWVVRVDGNAVPRLPFDPGPWEPFQRGALSWRLTVRADGTLPLDGVAPSFIAWEGEAHPSQRLPEAGCTLESLHFEHPRADEIQRTLTALGLSFRCVPGPAPLLSAELRTPTGLHVLSSTEPIAG